MTASHYHEHVDDPAAVGSRLKRARLAAGMSQRALSFRGCSAAYVSRLEAGDRVPSAQLARKLADRLGVGEAWLLRGDPAVVIEVTVAATRRADVLALADDLLGVARDRGVTAAVTVRAGGPA